MAQADVWYTGNDMVAELRQLRSSTMGSTSYLTGSTGVTVTVWDSLTTASTTTRLVNARNMPWSSGSTVSGHYRVAIQSSESTAVAAGDRGLAIITVSHSGLNGEWRVRWRADTRRES